MMRLKHWFLDGQELIYLCYCLCFSICIFKQSKYMNFIPKNYNKNKIKQLDGGLPYQMED